MLSLPPRERGLKYAILLLPSQYGGVAPPAGAWIEISSGRTGGNRKKSLPPRERGLKFYRMATYDQHT